MVSLLPDITGSFSTPAGGNPTGAMVEAAYAHHGLDVRYVNCDVAPERLADAVAGARAMGWIGFNCSLPHKVAVIDLIDGLNRSAELIGAVNCVVLTEGRMLGHNTDGQGFLGSLRTVADPAGQHVLLLGAGGAARAIAVELALAGAAHVTVANRSVDKAVQVAALVADHTATTSDVLAWDGRLTPPAGTTVVVNATSLGLPGSGDVPFDVGPDAGHLVVCDVIPNPPDTDFLQRARAAGATTLEGRGMLIDQAAVNIALWTGVDPDRSVMGSALDEAIGGWEHP
ncbi:shikimate dehydrogenase [uncultured Phycicoccus sp.]|uniref:shikimate dehydrogenase n=1 Tax=uncultured Phycicoccus sp. TaxID=661422 RepID=UPI0026282EE1|nr:shikimate dehydrogenase [uncultured Phycicoccus sp.]